MSRDSLFYCSGMVCGAALFFAGSLGIVPACIAVVAMLLVRGIVEDHADMREIRRDKLAEVSREATAMFDGSGKAVY